ncbi:MAG: FkbM family methyltransferase [Acidobacteriaceae bacterium]
MSLGIRYTLRKLGYDIRRFDPLASPAAQLSSSLRKFGIDAVFDVGANQGQFASGIRDAGFKGKTISFEPLSSAHSKLLKASDGDPNWNVFSRCALGDRNGEIEINVAGNSESSSILPMLATHLSAAPQSAYVEREMSPITTLDAVAGRYLKDARAPFLKIDTQGFEWQVLEGAKDTLPRLKGVMLELSLVPLYEGQRLWQEMIRRLENDGFTLWALQQGFTDTSTGRVLQMDGIFYRVSN